MGRYSLYDDDDKSPIAYHPDDQTEDDACREKEKCPPCERNLEDLLEETGGFGRFQAIVTICLFYNKIIAGWSMYQMTFAGLIPDWTCVGPAGTESVNWTENSCSNVYYNSSGQAIEQSCVSYNFSKEMNTAISQWDLVCDLDWVADAMTSIQMAGLFVGGLFSGQMADSLGRRGTIFLFILEHSVLNILAAFSPSWEVFTVYRFFIGVGIGGILVVGFTYTMEFLSPSWRAVGGSIPAWSVGVAIFALVAWQTHTWDRLHMLCGLCGLPALPALLLVPESPRWLTVKRRIAEAEAIMYKIARVNGRPPPVDVVEVLKAVERQETEARELSAQYTYLDLFRDATTARNTIIFGFESFSFSLITYGIAFGISALAGNIYLNIFLLEILVVPFQIGIFFTNNRCGRKQSAFPLIFVACLAAFACMALQEFDNDEEYGDYITGLSLVVKTGVSAAWSVCQTWGTEIYPTVTRNIGYGAANMAARVGGIIAPYVINFNAYMMAAYVTMGTVLFLDAVVLFWLPETRGKAMANSIAPPPKHVRMDNLHEETNGAPPKHDGLSNTQKDNATSQGHLSRDLEKGMSGERDGRKDSLSKLEGSLQEADQSEPVISSNGVSSERNRPKSYGTMQKTPLSKEKSGT